MRSKELCNYIYVLDYNMQSDCVYALDTHYMVACIIEYSQLQELINSRRVYIRNIDNKGIKCVIPRDKKVVLFKCNEGTYMVADYLCNLSLMTLGEIKVAKKQFPDIKFVGKGITTISGKIPYINSRAVDIYKMQSFNMKAAMIGISTLEYDFDYNNRLIITGIQNETDRLEIPNFVHGIANRAFINSNIKYAKIGNNIKVISSNAFANCKYLEKVDFGESVESIENRAFFGCSKLSVININDSLKEIQGEAFSYSGIGVLNRQVNNIRVDKHIRRALENYNKPMKS